MCDIEVFVDVTTQVCFYTFLQEINWSIHFDIDRLLPNYPVRDHKLVHYLSRENGILAWMIGVTDSTGI